MNTPRRDLTLLLMCALTPGLATADVYTWVDEQGTVHFQDAPPAAGKRAKTVKLLPVEGSRGGSSSAEVIAPVSPVEAPDRAAPASGGLNAARPPSKPQRVPAVELYTTSWCPWCRKAREYFQSRGVAFTEYDIDKDDAALERKLGLDGDKRVPTAIIDGRVVRGYSPSGYQAALERR